MTPTTSSVGILRYGPVLERTLRPDGIPRGRSTRPDPVLDRDRRHPGHQRQAAVHIEALTRDFLPRADLVLFVSLGRPPANRERAGVPRGRSSSKARSVLVLNKADLLRTDADLAEGVAFVGKRRQRRSGIEPRCSRSAWGAR